MELVKLRSYGAGWALIQYDQYPYKMRRGRDRDTPRGEGTWQQKQRPQRSLYKPRTTKDSRPPAAAGRGKEGSSLPPTP